ncbi:DUF2963 domain-containing protein [Paulownia witches'-broom phytoplasma]|uniref:DUF2963 domain-containing protein n=1 Tax=Paulownia witches'-broom phytoplasma TaxID=39647 RepID=UPI001CED4F4A|nr:DUF2963 domain-containing protein [Paulownia witches'-broom phytoplasma]
MFWIASHTYKYHLATEERRKLQEVDIEAKAIELNNNLYEEFKKIKEENEHLKSVPYEFIRDNGEKEYYNLFTHKLVKKIDKDNTIWEYNKNNGLLLKKTYKNNNVENYNSQGKLIKKTIYKLDGKTIDEIEDYNSQGKIVQKKHFTPPKVI